MDCEEFGNLIEDATKYTYTCSICKKTTYNYVFLKPLNPPPKTKGFPCKICRLNKIPCNPAFNLVAVEDYALKLDMFKSYIINQTYACGKCGKEIEFGVTKKIIDIERGKLTHFCQRCGVCQFDKIQEFFVLENNI